MKENHSTSSGPAMKRPFCLFLPMALAACQPAAAPTDKAAAAPAPSPAPVVAEWKPTAFNATSPTFSPNERSKFFTEFKSVVDKSAKGEFETTDAYKQRLANVDAVIQPFSTTDDYAFKPEYADLKYNADVQAYEPAYSIFCQKHWPIDKGVSCGMGSVTDSTESYSGQNAFGTRAEVTSERGRDLYFVFNPADLKGKQFRDSNSEYRLPVTCPVPIEKARTLQGKHVLSAIVVRLRKPEIISGHSRFEDATVASPQAKYYESVGIPAIFKGSLCFVQETGEILHVSSY